jgi:hypothetical protein
MVKFAKLVVSSHIKQYEGENIEGLKTGVNGITETEALNLLGAKGYDVYHTREFMDGQIVGMVFRLKTKPE